MTRYQACVDVIQKWARSMMQHVISLQRDVGRFWRKDCCCYRVVSILNRTPGFQTLLGKHSGSTGTRSRQHEVKIRTCQPRCPTPSKIVNTLVADGPQNPEVQNSLPTAFRNLRLDWLRGEEKAKRIQVCPPATRWGKCAPIHGPVWLEPNAQQGSLQDALSSPGFICLLHLLCAFSAQLPRPGQCGPWQLG